MSKKNSEMMQRDLEVIWHPCTCKSGQNGYLYDFEDNEYIDVVSSWWVHV